jgi:hypothetical protein
VYAIAMLVYVVLATIIPFSKPPASWVAFAFTVLAFIFGVAISIWAFDKGRSLVSKFYGFPVFRIGFLYTIVQILISILIFAVGAFVNLPYWIGLSISILLLGVALVGVIITDNARDYVDDVDAKSEKSTKTLARFNIDIADILDTCSNSELYEPLKKLNEKFKYSDQVSSPATEEKEEEIKQEIENLKNIINNESAEIVIDKIKLISNLLSSRNRVCEARK